MGHESFSSISSTPLGDIFGIWFRGRSSSSFDEKTRAGLIVGFNRRNTILFGGRLHPCFAGSGVQRQRAIGRPLSPFPLSPVAGGQDANAHGFPIHLSIGSFGGGQGANGRAPVRFVGQGHKRLRSAFSSSRPFGIFFGLGGNGPGALRPFFEAGAQRLMREKQPVFSGALSVSSRFPNGPGRLGPGLTEGIAGAGFVPETLSGFNVAGSYFFLGHPFGSRGRRGAARLVCGG